MTAVAGVRFEDSASGKIARVFSGPFDILINGPNPSPGGRRPCRRIIAAGAVSIIGLDNVQVDLPDFGLGYGWDIQATAIVSGEGVVLY